MLLPLTVEYALRAAVWLADHEEGQTTREIARATRVPPSYLSKVLQGLGRAGLVNGHRGIGGGFTLSRPPGEITVLEVVEAVEPLQRIRTCPLGIEAHGTELCALHRKLDNALAQVESAFAATSLAELLVPGNRSRPLCEAGPEKRAARGARARR